MARITKEFENLSYFEDLQTDSSFTLRPMFGLLAIYYRGLNVAVIGADPGDRTYRKIKYPFDLWDGILLPTSREHHPSLQQEWPALVSHPVLGKWLYLPQQTEDFETLLMEIVRKIRRGDPRFGVVPGKKNKAKQSASKKHKS